MRFSTRSWGSPLAAMLATILVFLGPAATLARAGVVSTGDIVAMHTASDAEQARQDVREVLERPEVVQQLAALGVDPAEAQRRVASLSDAEILALGKRIQEIPAGGSAVGAILGFVLIVFLVLLFTDLIGATDVFPWVNR